MVAAGVPPGGCAGRADYLFGGGCYQPEYEARCDVWASDDGVHWQQVTAAAPWHPRLWFSAAVYRNRMWVLGGKEVDAAPLGVGNKSDVWSSADGMDWTLATDSAPWGPRISHASVVHDGRIWVIGGYQGGRSNDVWYSSDGMNWTEATDTAP